jgi:SAM-dependent methyltransferase
MTDLFETYPNDARHMADYIAYQRRYATDIRESDKGILDIIARLPGADLLDIGCSTGNLLRHIRNSFPRLSLTGGDLSDMQLEECRRDQTLAGIKFEKLDIRDLPQDAFDLVVANAILYGFSDDSFRQCVQSIGRSLRAGGHFIAFDFFQPFVQEVDIVERSAAFPHGHPLHFRSFGHTEQVLSSNGFDSVSFKPFEIKIDLPRPGAESIVSYTVKTQDEARLLFRGSLFQPWCHLIAKKRG